MEVPQISIVVPVYDVEQYLRQCLDSIIAQTFTDWECILVNDGSKDGSGKICDDYAQKDNRFKVIHQENGGVSSARNKGIEEANGKWLYFCDADDTLLPNALEILLDGEKEGCQFVMAGFNKFLSNGNLKESYSGEIKRKISVDDAIKELYTPTDLSYQGYLWCKLFLASIVKDRNIRFDEKIYFNEDRLFIMQYLCQMAGSIYYTTTPVYNYVERLSGAMASLNMGYNRKFATDFDAYVKMKENVYNYTKNKLLRHLARKGIVNSYLRNHRLMVKHHDYDSKIHWSMLRRLFKTGAIKEYVKYAIKAYVYAIKEANKPIVLLLFPNLAAKYHK